VKNTIDSVNSINSIDSISSIDSIDSNIIPITHKVKRSDREKIKNQKGCVLWFTGLSGSGKSTIANALEEKLNKMGYHTYLLDGDNIRQGINKDLGFGKEDREENIRRVSEISKLFVDAGIITLTAFISPFAKDREKAKEIIGKDNFIEVFIDTPFEECAKRDPKGLYKRALNGEIKDFTGLDSPYEAPVNPELHIKTLQTDIDKAVDIIVEYLRERGFINEI